jgi:hypothetical protein
MRLEEERNLYFKMSSISAFYLGHVAEKLVMQKVCIDPIATTHLPNSFKGLTTYLDESVKHLK